MRYIKMREMKNLDEPAGEWEYVEVTPDSECSKETLAAFAIRPLYDFKGKDLDADHGFENIKLHQPWYK